MGMTVAEAQATVMGAGADDSPTKKEARAVLLAEARARGERFSLTYVALRGATGGRAWRTGPGVRTVRVRVNAPSIGRSTTQAPR